MYNGIYKTLENITQPDKNPYAGYNQEQLAYFNSNGHDLNQTNQAIISLLEIQGALSNKTKKKDEKVTVSFSTYKRESASHILGSLILYYKSNLPDALPPLWNELTSLDRNLGSLSETTVNRLCLLLHTGRNPLKVDQLQPTFLSVLPALISYISSPNPHVRKCCASIVACLAEEAPGLIIEHILDDILNSMAGDDIYSRKGSIELIYRVIDQLSDKIIAFTVLFIVPVLRLMSDLDQPVRQLSSLTFGKLIQLMPLEAGVKSEDIISERLARRRKEDRHFLEQLFDNTKCEQYTVRVDINATLRDYQVDGVNWLMFLNRFGLHGILSDEMGLGKTLQTIVVVASDHFDRRARNAQDIPTLIVSPPSVTGHWVEEINKFCPSQLQVLHYTGNNKERRKLQCIQDYNVLVTSYEVIRNDATFFQSIQWNYCVLDEGHVIRNTKTKVSQCIRSLRAKHRVILSGTPIQNSVTELWSLFDFLMPGFLGSEKQFYHQYGKAIQNSRDAKSSGKDHEAGILALKALHRQCLPFMLRRQKSDVLSDLPPKIIQDYCCDLSPLQKMLYEDFAKTRAKKSIESSLETMSTGGEEKSEKIGHIFQAIQYLQKLCNHPSLVLTRQHPEYENVTRELKKKKSSIMDIEHAPKFKALMQLLNDCGIGNTDKVVSEHRALIFCQHKSIIDLIETELFKSKMPSVSYMRLDGSVPAGSRHSIVSKFNHDPSIDVLLLTTKVGGLGLNLTGADVVIFMEHDWNPQMDLQAMDRAHRIGQKKTVNVYRLITRNTVEEKIMSLQRFKLNIANTVVSTDNSSMNTMSTGQILDLFSLQSAKNDDKKKKKTEKSSGINLVNELGELWEEREYDEEFKVNEFLEKLKN